MGMPNRSAIDRRSELPLYSQMKRLIRADIAERGLEPGDRMMGDHELCDRYDVSRTVVRQALLELEHEGAIRRERGRGTFVGDLRSSRGFGGALIGTFEDIQGDIGEQHSRVVRRGFVLASPRVATDLGVPIGSQVVEIESVKWTAWRGPTRERSFPSTWERRCWRRTSRMSRCSASRNANSGSDSRGPPVP